jgi:YD repeat-containing protein
VVKDRGADAVTHYHYDRAGHLLAETDAAGQMLRL